MNIALPILLLAFGGLSLWILTESTVKWYIKTACISIFCFFTIIFWSSIHSFLGWPANESDLPEKLLIHWVIVKEPNKFKEFDGAVYVLCQSTEEAKNNKISRAFGYKSKNLEPRLFRLEYSRELHEQLNKLKSRLQSGQPVTGKLTKTGKKGKAKKAGEGEVDKDGGGSESQKQRWEFHELRPSDFLNKPDS